MDVHTVYCSVSVCEFVSVSVCMRSHVIKYLMYAVAAQWEDVKLPHHLELITHTHTHTHTLAHTLFLHIVLLGLSAMLLIMFV